MLQRGEIINQAAIDLQWLLLPLHTYCRGKGEGGRECERGVATVVAVAIVAATINNNAMWQPTARISCKNLFMTLCCCHTVWGAASCPSPSPCSAGLALHCSGRRWCCQLQHCSPATDLWPTNRAKTIIGHISSHFLQVAH